MTTHLVPEVHEFAARDGIRIALAVYKADGDVPLPVVFAASPYRFDNNPLPASAQFLWRETGPIETYVKEGYAYVQMDLRGCGRSEGDFNFLGSLDQGDLYDAVQWIAAQRWSNGNVGSIGQSYFCMVQWLLAASKPPALKCVGAHDGLADLYRAGCYHGGIPCDFFPGFWWYQNRFINRFPAEGPSREQTVDLTALIAQHPLLDDFWKERSACERLSDIDVPLYSSGVWGKMQLHTRGNIDGYSKARGLKKLRMSGAPNAWAAAAEFASPEFHREVWLPFYDHFLKGRETSWRARAPVEYAVRGSGAVRHADQWPPAEVQYETVYLSAAHSGSVDSINDGSLVDDPGEEGVAVLDYPNPGWVSGVVGFGAKGPAGGFDAAKRALTFCTSPLPADLEIAGPIKLVLFAASTAADTEFFVKLSDQFPGVGPALEQSANPTAEIVSRGWLRASHRMLDPATSTDEVPRHLHSHEESLTPGQVYEYVITLEPQAYRFAAGRRIRVELSNGDSPTTEALWTHYYRPDKVGKDSIHMGHAHPSRLVLPVWRPWRASGAAQLVR